MYDVARMPVDSSLRWHLFLAPERLFTRKTNGIRIQRRPQPIPSRSLSQLSSLTQALEWGSFLFLGVSVMPTLGMTRRSQLQPDNAIGQEKDLTLLATHKTKIVA